MKILVDARELAGRPTGVGRYLLEILRRWSVRPDRDGRELVLCAPQVSAAAAALGFRTLAVGRGAGTRWEQWDFARAIRRESPDVVFAPAYTAPLLARPPVVLTVHDLSFVAHPEWFSRREGLRRRVLTRLSARRAAAVLTVSQFSAREIETAFGIPASRVRVIRHGVEKPTTAGPREPLVLFVGSVFNRRHVPALIQAVARVRQRVPAVRLAIVGENRSWPYQDLAAEAARAGVADAVEIEDYVPDARLSALYGRASAFAFVSEYEGFGLTPLEALASGIPPIVGDTPVAREVCGNAARFVTPGDVPALADALTTLLVDRDARDRLLAHAPAVLARHSWDRAADETLAALEAAGTARTVQRSPKVEDPTGPGPAPERTLDLEAAPKPDAPIDLAIVIVSFNVRDELARCLASLAAHPPRRRIRIVVVDNASTDGTVAMVRADWPSVELVPLADNRGFAAANNVGIRATRGSNSRWVLLLNSDTEVPAGAIDRLLDRAEAFEDVAVAGPRLVDAGGRPELSFGAMPGPVAEARQKRLVSACARGAAWAVAEVERRTSREQFPAWVSGACLLVRRAEAVAAGLLDERYFMYLEDADFCAAVRARGRRVLFTPAATVVHLRGRSRAKAPAAVERGYRRSQLAFYWKHHPVWAPVLWLYLAVRGRRPR